MEFIDENGDQVRYDKFEVCERNQAKKYIRPNDCVLELGARYGGVSVVINNILNDKTQQVSVEPDRKVWGALERNKEFHNCEFEILKGTISKRPQILNGKSWATHTLDSDIGDIPNYDLPDKPFNVLIADCEGFLEKFYRENKALFHKLRLVMFEKDRPSKCNYDYIIDELKALGFKEIRNNFHSIYKRD
jgi:hypothetical protein